jgi:hypothetical protein
MGVITLTKCEKSAKKKIFKRERITVIERHSKNIRKHKYAVTHQYE